MSNKLFYKFELLAVLMSLQFMFSPVSFAAPKYKITDLGTIGENESWANAINDSGQICGEYGESYPNSSGGAHGFSWSKETGMIDIGTIGGDVTYPWLINENGQAAGEGFIVRYKYNAFIWSIGTGIIDLGSLGGDDCLGGHVAIAYGLNDKGQVVGSSRTESCGNRAFLWTAKDGMMPISEQESNARDINNNEWIVGNHNSKGTIWIPENGSYNMLMLDAPYSNCRRINEKGQALCGPFLWSLENGLIDIEGPSGAYPIWRHHLNELGQVAGYFNIEDSNGLIKQSIFIWTEQEGFQDLGNLGGEGIWSGDINNRGEIVGEGLISNGTFHGFLASETNGVQDLNDLIDPNAGWEIKSALGINNKGQIAGQGRVDIDSDGSFDEAHACLLTPIYYVQIDIKPGSDTNCLNINGHGVIPAAILGSADFDVNNIIIESLLFNGSNVQVRGKKDKTMCHYEDVSGDFTYPEGAPDGHLDLVCQFEDDPSQWVPGQAEATLTGELIDGSLIEGTDIICIVP